MAHCLLLETYVFAQLSHKCSPIYTHLAIPQLTLDPLPLWSSPHHRPDEDILLLFSQGEVERNVVFLRRHVRRPRAPANLIALAHTSLLVFFKWPITGIIVEFVGFVGLFGWAIPMQLHRNLCSLQLLLPRYPPSIAPNSHHWHIPLPPIHPGCELLPAPFGGILTTGGRSPGGRTSECSLGLGLIPTCTENLIQLHMPYSIYRGERSIYVKWWESSNGYWLLAMIENVIEKTRSGRKVASIEASSIEQ